MQEMFEISPKIEGDKGSDCLAKAILLQKKHHSKQQLPVKIKRRICTPNESRSSVVQLLLQPPRLKSVIRRESEDIELTQTKTLASMIPDEILLHCNDQSIRNFEAAIMITDASGFTELSDKFNEMGKGGSSMLSAVLNQYMGTIVQEILIHGGDVLKFSGDAVLAIFKVTPKISMHDVVHKALDAALIIKNQCGSYKTDLGVVLKSKIAISAGKLSFSIIGTENYSHYVLVGQPLWDTKSCEKVTKSGHVLLTHQAWRYVNPMEYEFEALPDGQLFHVKGFKDEWSFVSNRFREVEIDEEPNCTENFSKTCRVQSIDIDYIRAEFSDRPSMKYILTRSLKDFLKRFMIPTVDKAIEMNEPLEHLNEMRQVVIVFVNLVTDNIQDAELINVANETFNEIHKITQFYEGTLNKVSLFDKDMMFLIIFGLRGFKHHIQSQIALRCAWEIKNTLTKFDHVISASVGVTTGKSYCGVVGYQKRQEYSVISMTVNVAARLMMAYPGKVTCDKKTYISSYLPVANFKNEETKVLKGLQNVGAIYEFVEISEIPINLTPDESRPCLYGRKDNLKIYEKRLKHAMEISKSSNQTQQNVILIVGKTGEGKSCLLDEMFACTQNHGINSFKITAHIENTRIPFGLTFHYMSTLMGLSKDANSIRRELLISELLDEYKINQLYFTLNPVLKVNFKVPEIVPPNVQDNIGEIQSRLFKILCRKLIQDFWVIFIDDIEFADEESILLLNHVFEVLQLFFVITTGTKRKLSVHAAKILTQFNIKPMILEPVDRVIQKTLACNFLKVEAIDIDIERAINLNSHGNPGWIERFLTSLTMDGLIQIEEVSLVDAKHKGLVFIDENKDDNENFISTSSFHCDEYDNENELNKCIKIANLSPDAHMEHLELEYTEDIDFIILYDSLTSFEQQILKCCSVLGRTFLRSTILYLLRENERQISLGIKHLVELGILSCGGGMSLHGNAYVQRQTKSTELDTVCVCSNLQIIESCKDLPRYANCGFMKFKSEQIMTTSYELLTDHQKKEYHKKILSYLENESKRCEACGGSYFESLQYFKRNILPEIEVQITQNLIFANDTSERFLNESFSVVNQKRENKPGVADSKLGLKMHFNKITPKQLTLPIGNISNAMCECNMILYLTFQDMVRHAKGADLQRKILETMMQHIEICFEVENYVRALCISEELQKFIETKYEFKKKEHEVYFMARFYTFKGVCYSSLNQIDAAREHFNMACNFLKLNIPKSWEINGWLAVWLVWRATRFLRKKSYGARTASVSVIYEQVTMQIIDTSMALSNFFKKTRELYLGVTVAALALYKVVRYSHNYTLIIKCYANFIDVACKVGKSDFIKGTLVKAFELAIYALKESTDRKLLETTSHLFYRMVFAIQTHGDIDFTMHLCHINFQMNKCLKLTSHQWKIISILCCLLMSQKRISDVLKLLSKYYEAIKLNDDRKNMIWYFALCLDVMLDTGITILGFDKCYSFYMENVEFFRNYKNYYGISRFIANMWLWCVRTKSWALANIFYEQLKEKFTLTCFDSPTNMLTAIRVFESLILLICRSLETRNIAAIETAEAETRRFIFSFENILADKSFHVYRYLLLRAYYHQVVNYFKKYKLRRTTDVLEVIARSSFSSGQFYMYEVIHHHINSFQKNLPIEIENFWINFCSGHEGRQYSVEDWLKTGNKLFPFTLKIPELLD